MCFIENSHEIDLEKKNIRAFARDENPAAHGLPGATSAKASTNNGRVKIDPELCATTSASIKPDTAFAISLIKRITEELRPEIRETIKRETDNTRAWFLNHGLPKATRVAQRETYDLLRAHGVIAKKSSNDGNVGRCNSSTEQRREGKHEREEKGGGDRLAAFLTETGDAIRQAAANSLASGSTILHSICQDAYRQLRELHDYVAADQCFDLQEIESRLAEAEANLAEALWQATDKSELETMLRSAKTELQPYAARMEKEVFEETLRRQVIVRLRERHGIPRISLFYL
jgi:hypothetical protein